MPRLIIALACLLFALPAAAAEPAPVHGLAMHGQPKYPAGFQHFDYVDPNAPKGGDVRLHAIGTFDSLHPFIVKGMPAAGIGMMFETLLTSSADEPFTEYGLIAETIRVPEDRSWVEFTLRPEARFHDGKPITVEDVIFSLDILKTKGLPLYRFYYAAVKKAEKTGPRAVRFTFDGGDNRELPLIVGQMPVLPKHYWENRQFDQTTLEAPLGSGPYRVASLEPGRFVVYERVADWWAKDLPVSRGLHNFDRIRYDYYRDTTVALEAFKAGEYDWRLENESKKWATGYDFPALAEGRAKKEEIGHDRPTGMQAFVFNQRRPLFQDARVRQALSYAFDFEWTNKNLFYGQYTRTESYFSNSELASEGLPSPAELAVLEPLRDKVPPEVFTATYQPPGSDGSGNIRDGLRKALDLLRQAGWTVEAGRLLDAQKRPFAFEILIDSATWERIALPYARNLERLGIVATVRTVDTAQYKNRVDAFDFDMIVDVWGQSQSPGNEQAEFWGSEAAATEGSRNTIGVKDQAVDALVSKIISAPDRETLVARTRALDRVLLWHHYVVPHWHIDYDRVAYWDKFGRPAVTPAQGVQFNAWWIKPPRAAMKTGMVPAKPGLRKGVILAQATQPGQPAGPASPTPAVDSPGRSPWVWVTLGAVVIVVALMLIRRRRRT
ncbi:MAG: ABC transporter substrate-binding protein [Alphaproteobacteria bacterium]|nr:ABC transporter substrate-binding protein [Alphaproteobacteria bacterium]